MSNLKKMVLPVLIIVSALSVSASAAYYSVTGLGRLFAGASLEVMIMASSLEAAKLVIATLLHQYWGTLNKILKVYLSIALVTLVGITSMGIYGFLSSAYQETYNGLTIVENKISFLKQKEDFYQKEVNRYDASLETISENIKSLSTAKATQIQIKDDNTSTGYRTTVSTTELRLAQDRLRIEEDNRKDIQSKRVQAADSLQKYQLAILELKNNSESATELGPLQYLSGLTGKSMDSLVNILLLLIVFVFDPLAISLVLAANFAIDQIRPKVNLYGEEVTPDGELWFDPIDKEPVVNPIEEPQETFVEPVVETSDPIVEDAPEPIVEVPNLEVSYTDTVKEESIVEGKKIREVLFRSPSKLKVIYEDGTHGIIDKKAYNSLV